jgi:hypothetical protein
MGMCRFPAFIVSSNSQSSHGMGRAYQEELNNDGLTMRVRNLIADAKVASVDIMESSEAGPQPPNDTLPLNNIYHGCITPKRDLEDDQRQTR